MTYRPVLLVAEDEPLIAELIGATLNDAGFQVVVVGTAMAAICELERQGQDFAGVVTDIRMGAGASGWDVARRARQLIPNVHVVYMSGDCEEQWRWQGVPHSLMLAKPFLPAQLVGQISSLLAV